MGSNYTNIFSPITIRGIEFKNRLVLAPQSVYLIDEKHQVTNDLIDWHRQFARGGVGTMYIGNASIDINESCDEHFQLDLSTDDCIYGLAKYASMGKQYQCHASVEINHGGEGNPVDKVGGRPSISASSFLSEMEITAAKAHNREPMYTVEMTKNKIKETVEKYANAALRMQKAGIDIVMVHGGHGNLISQFTSPMYNHRTDEYGGSLENRARFAIEVCQAIREKCGERFVIEYRISADEIDEKGMHFDETLKLIGLIKPYIDILHVSAGLRTAHTLKYYRNWCQNYMMDHCFNVHYAADIKKAYPDLYVTTVGSIVSLDYAEEIIKTGQADFVAMCRPLMADPEMAVKYAHNKPEEQRPCLRCDTCTKHLFVPKPIYCAVNPMSAMATELRDGVVPKAPVKKKVAVIGAGPAGVQGMMTLADRGHDVTLYEKSDVIGGNVIYAAAPPFKKDCNRYLTWLRTMTNKYSKLDNVRVLMNTEATKEVLDAENYDAILIATGSQPFVPPVPGHDMPQVIWAPLAEEIPEQMGDKLVVIGAGSVGLEAGLDFFDQGKDVVVIEMLPQADSFNRLYKAAGPSAKEFRRIYQEKGIDLRYGCALSEIKEKSIVYKDITTGEMVEIPADNVLMAVGMRPLKALNDSIRHCAPETDVYLIGDARGVGTIAEATNQAFQAALHI